MKEFLNRPYPFSFQPERRIKQLIPIALFVFSFLVIFKPFGLDNGPDLIITAAYLSFSGTLTGFLTTVLIPYLFPLYFNESTWTLKRNFIWNTWIFFIFATLMFIAFNIYLIYRYDDYSNFTFNTYLWWIYINLLFGLPLGIIINLINQYFLLKKHLKIAGAINNTIEAAGTSQKEKPAIDEGLTGPNKTTVLNLLEFEIDKFKKINIEADNIIYVEAFGNYINVVYKNTIVEKITVRGTISALEERLKDSKIIYRPHRSYLVNLNYIVNVTGDAQGLKVHFSDINNAIPVSRNKIKEFKLLTSSKNGSSLH